MESHILDIYYSYNRKNSNMIDIESRKYTDSKERHICYMLFTLKNMWIYNLSTKMLSIPSNSSMAADMDNTSLYIDKIYSYKLCISSGLNSWYNW